MNIMSIWNHIWSAHEYADVQKRFVILDLFFSISSISEISDFQLHSQLSWEKGNSWSIFSTSSLNPWLTTTQICIVSLPFDFWLFNRLCSNDFSSSSSSYTHMLSEQKGRERDYTSIVFWVVVNQGLSEDIEKIDRGFPFSQLNCECRMQRGWPWLKRKRIPSTGELEVRDLVQIKDLKAGPP